MKKYYIKKSIIPPIYIVPSTPYEPSCKLSINKEIMQNADINKFDITRCRLRYSMVFTTDKLCGWRLDMTCVKETKQQHISEIKKLRNRMFRTTTGDFMEDIDWDYIDRIELEMEYIYPGTITMEKIINARSLFKCLCGDTSYGDCVYQIAKIIKPHSIDKFKSGTFGLKQLNNNPAELTKKMYITDILPNISSFTITEKIRRYF